MMISAMGATASGGGAVGSSKDHAERLSDEDLTILALENEMVAGHTCKVILLENRIEPDALRASIASRLDRAPRLSLRLADVDGEPSWVPAPEVDYGPLEVYTMRHPKAFRSVSAVVKHSDRRLRVTRG